VSARGSADPPGRPSAHLSGRRIVPVWIAIGFGTGFVLLALASVLGTPAPGASASPGGSVAGDGGGLLRAIGLVTNIDASSPIDVRTFTLRTDDGRTLVFTIVPGIDTGFPPGHLQEHRASGAKVLVTYHVTGSANLVDILADAPLVSAPPS
jgi:hypothetical protein